MGNQVNTEFQTVDGIAVVAVVCVIEPAREVNVDSISNVAIPTNFQAPVSLSRRGLLLDACRVRTGSQSLP
jgi:hypothetical protein